LAEKSYYDGLDFKFDRKRKLGIIGRNGLGKTTLFENYLGELQATAGEVVRSGERTNIRIISTNRALHWNDENTVIQELGDGREWIMFGEEQMKVWT